MLPQSSDHKGSTTHRKEVPKGKKKLVLKESNGIAIEDYAVSSYSGVSPSSAYSNSPPVSMSFPSSSLMSPIYPAWYMPPPNYYDQTTFNSPYYFNAYANSPQRNNYASLTE